MLWRCAIILADGVAFLYWEYLILKARGKVPLNSSITGLNDIYLL